MDISKSLLVAVDGGGSTCRASIADWSGKVLGHAVGKPANPTTDFEDTRRNILETVAQAYGEAGFSADRITQDYGYLGLAGANIGTVARDLENSLEFFRSFVTSDRETTVHGALGPGDGTVALFGTGSFFASRQNGTTRNIGGWGLQLGDDGGGAYICQQLLRQTLLAHDGVVDHSPLTREILRQFANSPSDIVSFAASAAPSDYGKFAPQLITALDNGDPVAGLILGRATTAISRTLDVLNTKASGALYVLGGLGPSYQKLLAQEYQALLKPAAGDAISGAISLARQQFATPVT